MTARADLVTISAPGDVVSAVPHLLGFVPSESVVVMTLHGQRRRLGLTMRFDLVPPDQYEPLTAVLAARTSHERPRSVFVVVFTERPAAAGEDLPGRDLFAAVERSLGRLPVEDGLLVQGGRWWSYVCREPRCCDASGVPLDPASPAVTALAAAHAWRGRSVLPDREAMVATLQPLGRDMPAAMHRAVQRLVGEVTRSSAEQRRERALQLAAELVERYTDPRATVTEGEAAYLQLTCHDVAVRDAVLMRSGDDTQVDLLRRVLRDVVRRGVPLLEAPVCAMYGWLAYDSGDGTLAMAAVERALAADPGYSLAMLLDDAIDGQVPPSRLRQAWRPGGGSPPGRSAGS